jgi:CheY-like chemotaxis protein
MWKRRSAMQRTTSTWMRPAACFPHSSNGARRALRLLRASSPARSNSMPWRVVCWRIWTAIATRGARCANGVLVVDDYSGVREFLAQLLEDAGFVVRTAANGLPALIAAYEMRPRVIVVMDVSMPVLDGIEATRAARVITYTGNPSLDDSPTRTLFAAVLTKPATPGAVLAMVQHVAGL